MKKLKNKICAFIERQSLPKINWIKTIYLNFRLLPFSLAKKLPFIVYGNPVINSLSGKIVFKCPIRRGLVEVNVMHPFAPSLQTINSQICICGTLVIEGPVVIGRGCKILVAHSGVLVLGKNTLITDFVNISCWSKISVGQGVMISHRSQLLDSNQHYLFIESSRIIPDCRRRIIIGRNCWICNSSNISPGAVIPDNTVVASNSLVNKDISDLGNNIIVGGSPAKLLKRGVVRVCNLENEKSLFDYFSSNDMKEYSVSDNIDLESLFRQQ